MFLRNHNMVIISPTKTTFGHLTWVLEDSTFFLWGESRLNNFFFMLVEKLHSCIASAGLLASVNPSR